MPDRKFSFIKQPKIGKLIRLLRLEIELTQEQSAAKLGGVYPTVNRWEKGHTQPSPLALKQVECSKRLESGGRNYSKAILEENDAFSVTLL